MGPDYFGSDENIPLGGPHIISVLCILRLEMESPHCAPHPFSGPGRWTSVKTILYCTFGASVVASLVDSVNFDPGATAADAGEDDSYSERIDMRDKCVCIYGRHHLHNYFYLHLGTLLICFIFFTQPQTFC